MYLQPESLLPGDAKHGLFPVYGSKSRSKFTLFDIHAVLDLSCRNTLHLLMKQTIFVKNYCVSDNFKNVFTKV
jgi:hypothetical protein